MKKCVCCGRETYHKVGEQTVCARCDVDGSFEYHLKKQAAQQSVQSDVAETSAMMKKIEKETASAGGVPPKYWQRR